MSCKQHILDYYFFKAATVRGSGSEAKVSMSAMSGGSGTKAGMSGTSGGNGTSGGSGVKAGMWRKRHQL